MSRTPRIDAPASDLPQRYVDAATRSLPVDQRDDYADELRASIRDQIDDRVAAGEPADKAEYAVLTELGDPAVLAAKYADRPLHLIGPRYYSDWKWLLTVLLWIVMPFAALGGGISGALQNGGEDGWVGAAIGGAIGVMLSAGVHTAFWTTLLVVIIERDADRPQRLAKRGKGFGIWTPDTLPLTQQRRVALGEVVTSFVALAVVVGFVIWDRAFGVVFGPVAGGRRIPVLHDDLWPWWIAGGIALAAASSVLVLIGFLRRRWTVGLAVVNAALSAVGTVAALVLYVQGRLIHPAFIETVLPIPAEALQVIGIIVGIVLVGTGAWNAWDGFRRARSLKD